MRASTPAARDAMLRLAVEEAVQSAALGSTLRIGGMRPAQLIGGLAADLEVADADARRMALGGVAKKLRDLLVGACAAVRKGDEAEVLRAAAAVAAVLEALPLGEGSAEGEMVAAGIRSVFGRKERERVLEAVEAVAEGSSVAEMARELLDLASPEWAPGMGPD